MKSEHPLLSVIVACYNLEQYVDRCVSSIVAQTYQNLEIILIDDGSSDQTGKLCDAWQDKDHRIRVIHQPNEGPSMARKNGIENASSDYITFVDADDWIDKNMYTDMMKALLSTNSDIAQCGYRKVYEDNCSAEFAMPSPYEVVNRQESVLLILEDIKWKSFMWNKIFKKHLFDNVVFLKGLDLAEDFICQYLFHNASQSVYLSNEYYFYYQREESLLKPANINMKIKS